MKQRKLGSLDRPRDGPRLHGHVRVLRHDRRGRGARHDRPRPRAGLQLPRHGRDVRPVQERGAAWARRSPAAATSSSIATKFGIRFAPTKEDPTNRVLDGSPENARNSIEGSLKRLGTDHVDLWYLHRVDFNRDDRGDRRRDGASWSRRARCATSDSARPRPRRCAARTPSHPITALQTEYSLWTRDVEAEILPTCRELGIGFVPYSPLGRGFLSGRFKSPDDLDEDDFRRHGPRFQGEALEQNLQLAAKVEELAAREGLHARAARARVGARAGRRRRPDPRARSAASTWRRTSPRPTSSCPRTTSRASTRRCRRQPATATTASG